MSGPSTELGAAGKFPSTRWSRVMAAGSHGSAEERESLAALCEAYWYPLYAFIRRKGYPPEQAKDHTQDFFAYLLDRDVLAKADPGRGRFRAFLRTVCGRFLIGLREHASAHKRGGGRRPLSIDAIDAEGRYARELADPASPERIFDRAWALTVLGRVLDQLGQEYNDAGRLAIFEELRAVLVEESGTEPYRAIALRLGTSEGAVRVAAYRMRRRYGALLRSEIAKTIDDPLEVDEEIRELFSALSG
jgi:RNA polymerase sigma factor (sigma-70 family)